MGRGKRQIAAVDYFPALPRKDGRFQKKIKGKLHYFGGRGVAREQALAEYQRMRRALYEGRTPPPSMAAIAGVSVRDLMNLYLDERSRDVESGRIGRANHAHSTHALKRFAAFIGPDRPWAEIVPADFSAYVRDLDEAYGVFNFNHHLAHLNAFWHACVLLGWIDREPNRGPQWRKQRLPLRQREDVILSAAQVAKLLRQATPMLRAMVLFALNGGCGPTDCATLEWEEVDGGWYDGTRRKTGIPRRFPLWPITQEALRVLPRERAGVFSTMEGQAWLPTSIVHAFRELADAAGVALPAGQGLRCCRYTFATMADATLDINAKRLVMGHVPAGMDRHYVRLIGDERLRKVVEHVRRKLKVPGRLREVL